MTSNKQLRRSITDRYKAQVYYLTGLRYFLFFQGQEAMLLQCIPQYLGEMACMTINTCTIIAHTNRLRLCIDQTAQPVLLPALL